MSSPLTIRRLPSPACSLLDGLHAFYQRWRITGSEDGSLWHTEQREGHVLLRIDSPDNHPPWMLMLDSFAASRLASGCALSGWLC
jgi:hypothetical protein